MSSHLQLTLEWFKKNIEDKGDGGKGSWEERGQRIGKKHVSLLVFDSVLVLGREPRTLTC